MSCRHAPIFKQICVVAKVVLRQPNNLSTSCCHVATSDRWCAGAEAVPNRKPRSEWHGWETSFKQALLLRAEGWRPSDRKCKHLTPLVGCFYAKTACQMLACSTIQVQLHSHLTKIIPTNGVKCASQLWGRRRRTRRR